MTAERLQAIPIALQRVNRDVSAFFNNTGPEYLTCDLRLGLNRLAGRLLCVPYSFVKPAIEAAIALESQDPPIIEIEVVGKDGKIIHQKKFATLRHHKVTGNGFRVKNSPHPDATKIGSLLRITSLDELPQIEHIADGDLTVYGVRAPMPATLDEWLLNPELAATAIQYKQAVEAAPPGCLHPGIPLGRGKLTELEIMDAAIRFVKTASLRTELMAIGACILPVLTGYGSF